MRSLRLINYGLLAGIAGFSLFALYSTANSRAPAVFYFLAISPYVFLAVIARWFRYRSQMIALLLGSLLLGFVVVDVHYGLTTSFDQGPGSGYFRYFVFALPRDQWVVAIVISLVALVSKLLHKRRHGTDIH